MHDIIYMHLRARAGMMEEESTNVRASNMSQQFVCRCDVTCE
jgi:hypothetical protein